jgi:GTP-binding protein HflX
VVVADTVGFIRELPHELVAAFSRRSRRRARPRCCCTWSDVSDPRRDEHIDEVNRVLAEIGAADLPQILVFNKIDRLERRRASSATRTDASPRVLSAIDGRGLDTC